MHFSMKKGTREWVSIRTVVHTTREYLPDKLIMYSETYAFNSLDTSTKRIQLLILSPIKDVHISTNKNKAKMLF